MSNDTIRAARINAKSTIIAALITAIIGAVVSLVTFFYGQSNTERKTVEILSDYIESVDENASYQKTLQTVSEEYKKQENQIGDLKSENQQLQQELSDKEEVELKNVALISDGLKIQENVNKAILLLDDNNTYYSETMLNLILKNQLSYDHSKNTVFFNTTNENILSETKIDLFDTNVLYDGTCYKKFIASEGESFSMGSDTYNEGFEIYDDHSLFGEGDGYALFDLNGEYSKMSFLVGRTNEYEKQDVILKVYLDNEYVEEYSLNSQSPPVSLTIDLNYANNLKLEITGGSRVKYGFANVLLYY